MVDKKDIRTLRKEWLSAALDVSNPNCIIEASRALDRVRHMTDSRIIDYWIEFLKAEHADDGEETQNSAVEDYDGIIQDITKYGFEFAAVAIGDNERAAELLEAIVNNPHLVERIRKYDRLSSRWNGRADGDNTLPESTNTRSK